MIEIKIAKDYLSGRVSTVLEHVADLCAADADRYRRVVLAYANDPVWRGILAGAAVSRLAEALAGYAASIHLPMLADTPVMEVGDDGYTLRLPAVRPGITQATIQELISTFLTAAVSGELLRMADMPALQEAEEAASRSLRALLPEASSTFPKILRRRMTVF